MLTMLNRDSSQSRPCGNNKRYNIASWHTILVSLTISISAMCLLHAAFCPDDFSIRRRLRAHSDENRPKRQNRPNMRATRSNPLSAEAARIKKTKGCSRGMLKSALINSSTPPRDLVEERMGTKEPTSEDPKEDADVTKPAAAKKAQSSRERQPLGRDASKRDVSPSQIESKMPDMMDASFELNDNMEKEEADAAAERQTAALNNNNMSPSAEDNEPPSANIKFCWDKCEITPKNAKLAAPIACGVGAVTIGAFALTESEWGPQAETGEVAISFFKSNEWSRIAAFIAMVSVISVTVGFYLHCRHCFTWVEESVKRQKEAHQLSKNLAATKTAAAALHKSVKKVSNTLRDAQSMLSGMSHLGSQLDLEPSHSTFPDESGAPGPATRVARGFQRVITQKQDQ